MRQTTFKLIRRVYIQKVLKINNRKSVNIDIEQYRMFFNTLLAQLEHNLKEEHLTGK